MGKKKDDTSYKKEWKNKALHLGLTEWVQACPTQANYTTQSTFSAEFVRLKNYQQSQRTKGQYENETIEATKQSSFFKTVSSADSPSTSSTSYLTSPAHPITSSC